MVAVEGDLVTLNWKCFSEDGEVRRWGWIAG